MKGRTTIITSHRPSLLRQADRIFFIYQGRMREEGDHGALMAKQGLYATMYRGWEEASRADLFPDRGNFACVSSGTR